MESSLPQAGGPEQAGIANAAVRAGGEGKSAQLARLVGWTLLVYGIPAVVTWLARNRFTNTWHDHAWIDQLLFKGMMAGGVFFVLWRYRLSLHDVGLRPPAEKMRWGAFATSLVLLNIAASIVYLSLRVSASDKVLGSLTFWQAMSLNAYICAIEELFIRGWFQTCLARILGAAQRTRIVWGSAAMFGLLHVFLALRGVTPLAVAITMATTFLLGLLVAGARERSGSVVPAMIGHYVYNATGIILGYGWWYITTNHLLSG